MRRSIKRIMSTRLLPLTNMMAAWGMVWSFMLVVAAGLLFLLHRTGLTELGVMLLLLGANTALYILTED